MSVVESQNQDGVVTVALNRPEVHNALNLEIMVQLTKLFGQLKKEKRLRVVSLLGRGANFCAGGDLNWMKKAVKAKPAEVRKDSRVLADMYEALYQCPVPLLASVHGNIMGGGVGLLAVCDWVVADIGSRFCFSEVKLGLVPSIISPYLLRKSREAQLLPWMTSGGVFGVMQAQSLGLIHLIGLDDKNRAELLQKQMQQVAGNAPDAVREIKSLMRRLGTLSWQAQRHLSIDLNAKRRRSAEGQEGMQAFFEKRPPQWQSK